MTPSSLSRLRSACLAPQLKRRTLTKLGSIDPTAGHVGLTLSNHPLGLLVLDANPLDLAFKAGMRNGDVIITLNGRAVLDHREAVEMISKATERLRLTYYDAAAAAIELVVTGTNFATLNFSSSSISSHTARGSAGVERATERKPASQLAPQLSDRRSTELKRDLTRGSNLLAELAGLHHRAPPEQTTQASQASQASQAATTAGSGPPQPAAGGTTSSGLAVETKPTLDVSEAQAAALPPPD